MAIPLPQPVGFLPGDDYKLALSFDGDRLHTPWLTLLGKSAPEVPLVEVTLVRLPGHLNPVTSRFICFLTLGVATGICGRVIARRTRT